MRNALAVPFDGARYPQRYYLGDVRLARELARHAAHLWLDPRGLTLVLPVGQLPYWRVFADVTCRHALDGTPSLAFFQTLMAGRTTQDGRFDIVDLAWSSTFILDRRQAQNYRRGRVFLAGGAAHVFSPFGGQGMNAGVQDAYNLAWKLAAVEQGILQPDALDTYHRERSPLVRKIGARVHNNTRFLTLRNPLVCALRNASMRLLLASRRFCRAIVAKTAQLNLSYHGLSNLVAHHDRLRRPRAGDRAPDAPLPPVAKSDRLFTLRQGNHMLLLFSAHPKRAKEQHDLEQACACARHYLGLHMHSLVIDRKTASAAYKRYNVREPTVILIRPDGYIGYRAPAYKQRALQRYMVRNYRAQMPSSLTR